MARQPAKPRTPRAKGPRTTKASAANGETTVDQILSEPEEVRLRSESMGSEPSEEDVRLRAYHRYLERGGGHGLDFEDWLHAEQDLKKR